MIEKLDRHIKTEENGVRISCPPTHADCIDKINELINTVNRLEESVQGVVNNSINDGGRIRLLQEQIHALKTRSENVQSDPESRSENVHELVTLTDMFNEMGRLYADLWNKLEDIHFELRNKGENDESRQI